MVTRGINETCAIVSLLTEALASGPALAGFEKAHSSMLRERVLARAANRATDQASVGSLVAQIDASAAEAPEWTETVRAAQLPWTEVWPGVWARVLRQEIAENLQITLFRMRPESVVPAHDHGKEEECLVLEGELSIGPHRVGVGDLHIARAGSHHPQITTRTGALLLVRSEIARPAPS